jgi:hypothetical protein
MSFKQEYKGVWRGTEVKIRGKKVVGKTIFEAGLIVEGNAKLLCPVNWGYLAASITTQEKGRGTAPGAPRASGKPYGKPTVPATMKIQPPMMEQQVYVGTPLSYGPWVEYGTAKMEPQSFLRPALAMAQGKTLTLFVYNGRVQFKDFIRGAA